MCLIALRMDIQEDMGSQALSLGGDTGRLSCSGLRAGMESISLAALAQNFPLLSPEPDNEAHIRSSSRPCSPVHHHEGHTKLSSSPPRASPVRMGPSYVLKKGSGAVMNSAGDDIVTSLGHFNLGSGCVLLT